MNDMTLRTTKLDITGRSPILNTAAIIINLIAVFLLVKGFHLETNPDTAFYYQIAGTVLLVTTLTSMFVLKGLFLFSYVARVLVGGLFIVSGLVKANDPWGFAFKLEEYFEPSGLSYDFPFFESFSGITLELAVFICIAEIVLGVAVILGGKIKLASWSLVIMMAFFTWLTSYTHSCGEAAEAAMAAGETFTRQCVNDCGCFGDALKGSVGRSLTPHESYWKDLVLFYFCLIIFINQWKIRMNTVKENWILAPASLLVVIFFSWVFGWMFPVIFTIIALLGAFVMANLNIGKIGKAWKMAIFVTFVSVLFGLYTANYLPFKDYRPYAVGNNIGEQMTNGVDEVSNGFYVYQNKATGEEVRVAQADWSAEYGDTTKFKYLDWDKEVIVPGVPASIQDFSVRIEYDQLSDADKAIPYIDSLIKADYEMYYEEKMAIYSVDYGMDTIPSIDFDTLYYPDSMYTVKSVFTALIDPSTPYGLDLTQYLITTDVVFIMTVRDMASINENSIEDFKGVLAGAREKNIPFFVLCSAGQEEIDEFRKKHELDATYLTMDGVEIKIIIRSNPGLVLLKKGTVMDKWPSRSVEDFEDIYEDYIQTNEN